MVDKFNNNINDLLKEMTKRLIIIKHTNYKLIEDWIFTNKTQIDEFFFKNNN